MAMALALSEAAAETVATSPMGAKLAMALAPSEAAAATAATVAAASATAREA